MQPLIFNIRGVCSLLPCEYIPRRLSRESEIRLLNVPSNQLPGLWRPVLMESKGIIPRGSSQTLSGPPQGPFLLRFSSPVFVHVSVVNTMSMHLFASTITSYIQSLMALRSLERESCPSRERPPVHSPSSSS